MRHVERSVKQVADIIREITLITSGKSFFRKICVFTDCNITHQIIPHCFRTVLLDERVGIDDVAQTFAHLRARDIPPSVHQQCRHLIVGKSEGVQHDRPVNAVRGNHDILSDDV